MAKLSMIAREVKREKLEKKYRSKRIELKQTAKASYVQGDIPWDVLRKLQSLPRNSNRSRQQRRCRLCGRPHGVYQKFGMCRLCLRKYAMQGFIPGLTKASW